MLRRLTHPLPFGKYLLLELINAGGMAEVFKAKVFGVAGFERVVAIKRIWPHWAEDEKFTKMFIDEARIAVQLTDPNIVQIFELGITDKQHYIAMEYVAGRDLRQLLDRLNERGERLPITHAAYVATGLCAALDYAHRKTDLDGRPMNIIHRDVSPQNVLVGYDGAIKVADFGIAKAEHRLTETQSGSIKGKFGYMSPEQARGDPIDRRSDIFAVGILLHEMMTGSKLFDGASDFTALQRVRDGDVESPATANPEVPPELEKIVLRALAVDPNDRYQWASELSEDLQQFLIEEKTIFTAQRMAAFMRDLFADDIRGERARMEEMLDLSSSPDTDPGESDLDALERRLTAATVVRERPAPSDGETDDGTIVIAASSLLSGSGPQSGSGEWGEAEPIPAFADTDHGLEENEQKEEVGRAEEDHEEEYEEYEEHDANEADVDATAITVRGEPTAVVRRDAPSGTSTADLYVGEDEREEITAVVTPTSIAGAPRRKRVRPGVVFVTLSIGVAGMGGALLYASIGPRLDRSFPAIETRIDDDDDDDDDDDVLPADDPSPASTDPISTPTDEPPRTRAPSAKSKTTSMHRTELNKVRRAIDATLRKQGILDGDVPALDAQRARMAQLTKRGRFADARAAGDKVLALAKRVEVNQRFVMRKLDRFNRQFDKAHDIPGRRKLDALTREITTSVTRGDYRAANRQLNQAFRILGGR